MEPLLTSLMASVDRHQLCWYCPTRSHSQHPNFDPSKPHPKLAENSATSPQHKSNKRGTKVVDFILENSKHFFYCRSGNNISRGELVYENSHSMFACSARNISCRCWCLSRQS
ncbi:hypothetical protein RIF29_38427 [Crotalaria pallida]|uniref:Uncharacterized protein n=1 Tax=Crotalaria pallida TaxID=3830 RepID=A0AAN9E052_CROPI